MLWYTLKDPGPDQVGKQEVDLFIPSQLVILQLWQALGGKSAQFGQTHKWVKWSLRKKLDQKPFCNNVLFLSLESMLSKSRYQAFHHYAFSVNSGKLAPGVNLSS